MGESFTTELASRALDLVPAMVRERDGLVVLWSAGMERLYGVPAAQAMARDWRALLSPELPWDQARIDAALRDDGVWQGELTCRRRDGVQVIVASRWTTLADRDGAILSVDTDITSERRAEADRARLAAIVEGSHDAIISKTLDGRVTSWNGGAAEVFGYAPEEMIGRPIALLFPPPLLAEEADILARLRRGERIDTYETTRLRKDGAVIPVSLSVSPIRDASGRVVGASKIARDISEQRRVQSRLDEVKAELFHVSRMNDVGQMALAFAHELNQPLAAASNYVSGVRRLIAAGDSEKALAGCALAARQLARTGAVVARLREFVKRSDGHRHPEDLSSVIEDGCALAMAGNIAEGAAARMRFAAEAATAVIDRVQIQQVVVNLVRNAVQAMAHSPRRELTVHTRRAPAGFVEVAVADTGPGVSTEARARLFQPFNTTKAAGLGVGLSLCRAIIEAHGGEIWADDNPGGGAVFRFTLPTD